MYLSQTQSTESFIEHDRPRSVANISDEISNEENEPQEEESEVGFELETSMSQEGNNKKKSTLLSEEEAEMRRTVQVLFELEESLLDQHITNIKENAEMLRQEDNLLQTIEQVDEPTDDEMDNYAIQLAEFLDRKEELIMSLQSKLDEYKMYSAREQQLAEEMNRLAC